MFDARAEAPMGECPDWYVGEPVDVVVRFDDPHSLTLACEVTYVWDEFVDVGVGDTIVRFDRDDFDCGGLEIGQPATVELDAFCEHMTRDEYDPQEEASHDGE
jgi:hypothetical protein